MTHSFGPSKLDGYDFTRIQAFCDSRYQAKGGIQTYLPLLLGQTDNPSVTYTTRIGRYQLLGSMCQLSIVLDTSSISKTTLTDAIQISLPFKAKNVAGLTQLLIASAYNATPVQCSNIAIINPNTTSLILSQQSLTTAPSNLTYAVGTGIGNLSNNITFRVQGSYEID